MHQGTSNHQTAFHPARQHPRTNIAFFPQIRLLQVFFAALDGFVAGDTIIPSLIDNDLLDRFKGIEIEFLGNQTNLLFDLDQFFV